MEHNGTKPPEKDPEAARLARPQAEPQFVPAKVGVEAQTWSERFRRSGLNIRDTANSLMSATGFACLAGGLCTAGVMSLLWPQPVPAPVPHTGGPPAIPLPQVALAGEQQSPALELGLRPDQWRLESQQ